MPTVLLPSWPSPPSWDGRLGVAIPFEPDKPNLQDVKEDWQPQLNEARAIDQIEAFAFPTPFAWAEMMSAVIRQDRFSHILFEYYEHLIFGLMLGYLDLEISDLESSPFGQVLAGTDSRYRYFGLLRGRATPDNDALEGKVFGGTSPDCLFWPSPRRTVADWSELKGLIGRDDRNSCRQILADVRALAAAERLWNPDHIAWMRALHHLIGDLPPSPGHKFFHIQSRQLGPIEVEFGNEHPSQPLYFPVYQPDFAANFLRGLTGTLKEAPGKIEVYDEHKKCFEILTPAVPPGGKILHAGTGTVRVLSQPRPGAVSDQIKLIDNNGKRGLLSYLNELRRATQDDNSLIKRRPFLYPDVFRIPVTRLGEAGLDQDVSFSKQAFELTFDPDSPGLPLAAELEAISPETSGVVLEYKDGNQTKRAIYVESYAGATIGDLRALGWVLWSYFISTDGERDRPEELEGNDDLPEQLCVKNNQLLDHEMTPIFKSREARHPFDLDDQIAQTIYHRIKGGGQAYQRLAAQQRFLKAYQQQANPNAPLSRLCLRAAQAFVKWVWPEWTERGVLENGHPPQKTETIKIGGNIQVTLLRDE